MIIAIVNTKGGVTKTTTATYLAHALATVHRKILIVDSDPQGSAMAWSKLVGAQFTPSVIPLAETDIHRRLPALAESFDHVVIDTPPGEGKVSETPIIESAVLAADVVVVPLSPTTMDLSRLAPTLELLGRVEAQHKHTPKLFYLLVRARANTSSAPGSRMALTEKYQLPLLDSEVPLWESYANAFGYPITVLGAYRDVMVEIMEKASNG